MRYYNEILEQLVRSDSGAIGPDFYLMDDNACHYRAHITNAYLECETNT